MVVTDLPTLPAGVYQHYKGPLYLVLGYGHDANHEDRNVVVYVGLELDTAHRGPRLAVRTVEDFLAWVDPRTGIQQQENWGGKCRRRFTYTGPEYVGAL